MRMRIRIPFITSGIPGTENIAMVAYRIARRIYGFLCKGFSRSMRNESLVGIVRSAPAKRPHYIPTVYTARTAP